MLKTLIACLLALWPLQGLSAIALIANNAVGSTGANTVSVTVNATGGNLIVIYFAGDNTLGSPSDNQGNTYTLLTSHPAGGGFPQRAQIGYCLNPTVSSSLTVTIAGAGAAPVLGVAVFSGVKTSSAFDTQNGNAVTGATSISAGSITPSVANELVFTGAATQLTASAIDSSFTLLNQVSFLSGNHYGASIAYKITGAVQNPTWTLSSSTNAGASIASFLPVPVVVVRHRAISKGRR